MAEATGLKSLAEGRSDMFRIDPRKLKIKDGWNSRDFNDPSNADHIDMLAKSIASVGVKEPLTVYWDDGVAWISDGECRLRGAMRAIEVYKAEIKTVPVKTEDRYASEAEKLFSQSLRNSGKPFTPMENAKLYKRLLDFGWAAKDIAEKQGISQSRVSQVLSLLTMPEEVKALVTAGTVSASMAANSIREAAGDGKAAAATLQAAAANAAAEGSTKVRPRHVGKKESVKTVVRDIFNGCHIDLGNEEAGIVIIRMSANDYATLKDNVPGIDD